jgi:uncharacterized protein YggE
MKTLLSSLVLLTSVGFASASVTVNGQGKVTYVPDVGYITVGVSSKGKTAEEAWAKNNEAVKKLFDALKARGIDPKDMQTANLSVSPEYIHPKDREPVLVGYVVSYDLKVTVRKLNELGPVLDDMVKNGANRNVSISFGCSDLDKLLDEARVKAIANAKHKADLYTNAAGAKTGRVMEISETEVGRPRVYHLEARDVQSAMPGLEIAAGQQELSVSVTVIYALAQ